VLQAVIQLGLRTRTMLRSEQEPTDPSWASLQE